VRLSVAPYIVLGVVIGAVGVAVETQDTADYTAVVQGLQFIQHKLDEEKGCSNDFRLKNKELETELATVREQCRAQQLSGTELEAVQDLYQDARKEVTVLRGLVSRLERQLSDAAEELESCASAAQQSEQQLSQAKATAKQAEAVHAADMARMETTAAEADQERQRLELLLADRERHTDELVQEHHADAHKWTQQHDSEVEQLKQQHSALVDELKRQLSLQSEQLTTVTASESAAKLRAEELQRELSQALEQVRLLKEERGSGFAIAKTAQLLEEANTRIEALEHELALSTTDVQELRAELDKVQSELDKVQSERNNAVEQCAEHQAEATQAKEKLQLVGTQLQEALLELDRGYQAQHSLGKQLGAASAELGDALTQLEKLKGELADAQTRAQVSETAASELTERVSSMKQQARSLTEYLEIEKVENSERAVKMEWMQAQLEIVRYFKVPVVWEAELRAKHKSPGAANNEWVPLQQTNSDSIEAIYTRHGEVAKVDDESAGRLEVFMNAREAKNLDSGGA